MHGDSIIVIEILLTTINHPLSITPASHRTKPLPPPPIMHDLTHVVLGDVLRQAADHDRVVGLLAAEQQLGRRRLLLQLRRRSQVHVDQRGRVQRRGRRQDRRQERLRHQRRTGGGRGRGVSWTAGHGGGWAGKSRNFTLNLICKLHQVSMVAFEPSIRRSFEQISSMQQEKKTSDHKYPHKYRQLLLTPTFIECYITMSFRLIPLCQHVQRQTDAHLGRKSCCWALLTATACAAAAAAAWCCASCSCRSCSSSRGSGSMSQTRGGGGGGGGRGSSQSRSSRSRERGLSRSRSRSRLLRGSRRDSDTVRRSLAHGRRWAGQRTDKHDDRRQPGRRETDNQLIS